MAHSTRSTDEPDEPPSQQQRSEHQQAVQRGKAFMCPDPHCLWKAGTETALLKHLNDKHPLPGDAVPAGTALISPSDIAHMSRAVNCELCGWWCRPAGLCKHQNCTTGPCSARRALLATKGRLQAPSLGTTQDLVPTPIQPDPVDLANHAAPHQLAVHKSRPLAQLTVTDAPR
jgi:hypothetical protein